MKINDGGDKFPSKFFKNFLKKRSKLGPQNIEFDFCITNTALRNGF